VATSCGALGRHGLGCTWLGAVELARGRRAGWDAVTTTPPPAVDDLAAHGQREQLEERHRRPSLDPHQASRLDLEPPILVDRPKMVQGRQILQRVARHDQKVGPPAWLEGTQISVDTG
jgi:hypothetical protein